MPLNRTLLELKRRPTNQLYAPIISQSNLIGIETINACLCHIPCFFSLNRTLLELKLPAVHLKSPEDLSLNRTLLELKLYGTICLAASTWSSQSNLIGIETGYRLVER